MKANRTTRLVNPQKILEPTENSVGKNKMIKILLGGKSPAQKPGW